MNKEDIKPTVELLQYFQDAIVDEIILQIIPMHDRTAIMTKIRAAVLNIGCTKGFPPRRITKESVTRCLDYAIASKLHDQVTIWIGIQHIHFKEDASYMVTTVLSLTLTGAQ